MSAQPDQTRRCPTCGNTVPAMARYCPNCGTRLDPAAAYSADDFEDALADVLDAPTNEAPNDLASDEPVTPVVTPDVPVNTPPIAVSPTSQPTEWTATASDWTAPTGQAGTWGAQTPTAQPSAKPRGKHTMWIILAIVGFLIFCCCGSFFALLIVAERDTAFQNEISNLAMLWIGFGSGVSRW